MKNSTNNKKYGYFIESVNLPTSQWIHYHCFRSTVSLDAAMWLFKQKDIRLAAKKSDVKFDPSYFRTKAGEIYPGVQIGAAFTTKEEFDKFDVAWNNGMAEAEVRRIRNARQRSGGEHGGTFLSRFMDKRDRSDVWTAKELVKEFFEGEYMDEMNKLIRDTEKMVEIRREDYGPKVLGTVKVKESDVSGYEHNQMNYEG
jgi:hypothetical protein